jgi:hypothetical protein
MDSHCPVMDSLGEEHAYMRRNWMLLTTTDIDMLRGCLITSCRHLCMVRQETDYEPLAIQYKLEYVKTLRAMISTAAPELGRMAVARAVVLAFDEVKRHRPVRSNHPLTMHRAS